MIKKIGYILKLYKVDSFDTIKSICQKFNIEESVLLEFNDINSIDKGKILYIPKQNSAIHIVKPTETIESICEEYKITKEYLLSKNNITTLFVGLKLYI